MTVLGHRAQNIRSRRHVVARHQYRERLSMCLSLLVAHWQGTAVNGVLRSTTPLPIDRQARLIGSIEREEAHLAADAVTVTVELRNPPLTLELVPRKHSPRFALTLR